MLILTLIAGNLYKNFLKNAKNKKGFKLIKSETLDGVVGVARFELTTSCSQSRRDTGLRYTPNLLFWDFI
jgi:hypothetical protein